MDRLKMTDRVEFLFDQLKNTDVHGWEAMDPGLPYCVEFDKNDPLAAANRRNFLTVMDEPGIEKEPIAIRKAKGIYKSFDQVELRILPEELIVGSTLSVWRHTLYATEEERRRYVPGLFGIARALVLPGHELPITSTKEQTMKYLLDIGYATAPGLEFYSWVHTCAGFQKVIDMGYMGIAAQAEELLHAEEARETPDNDKCVFWRSVILSCRGVQHFAERYSERLAEMAETEADPRRREELKKLSAITRRVPAYPPASFHEAVQSLWFSLISTQRFVQTDLGRVDQYLYPFYKKDLEAGIITPESAQELIDCLWLKIAEYALERHGHRGLAQSVMLGGRDENYNDMTNEITYMCLAAAEKFGRTTPTVSLRIHKKTPEDLFGIALRMLIKGLSMPDFYNDDVFIPAIMKMSGAPEKDACQYINSVCEEVLIGGMSEDRTADVSCIPLKCVEMTLNNGICFMQDVREGLDTGDPDSFETFDDFLAAMKEQVKYSIKFQIDKSLDGEELAPLISPQPLHSATIAGCVESGRDSTAGGAKYNNTGVAAMTSFANTVDSLYSIKRLCFDEKRMKLSELVQILKNNFEGHERLRLEIINKFPKFGNNNDEADDLAKWLYNIYIEEVPKYTNKRGGRFLMGAYGTDGPNFGLSVGASADGRLAGETLSMNLHSVNGRSTHGPLALLNSVLKLDFSTCAQGAMTDLKLSPGPLKDEAGQEAFKDLVKGFFRQGGPAIQFNVVNNETLEDALVHPENHKDLMVRVWGYSDYFVDVDPAMQKNIIKRNLVAL